MKKLLIAASVLATLSAQVLAISTPVGMAQSAKGYEISRQSDVLAVESNMPALVNSADRLKTIDSPVRLNTNNGEVIVLDQKSSALMTDARNVEFQSGRLAATLAKGSTTTVHFGNLAVKSIAGAASSEATIIGLASSAPTVLTVTNFGKEPLAVVDTKAGKQVATLAQGDTMTLAFDAPSSSWIASSSSPLVLQQQGDPTIDPVVEEDEDRRKKAAAWWWYAGGAAAGGALLYFGGKQLYEDQIDELVNGENDNNDRRESSPILFEEEDEVIVESR